jgi:hypothetical protein
MPRRCRKIRIATEACICRDVNLGKCCGGLGAWIPAEWLKKLAEKYPTEEGKKQIEAMGGLDKLLETLRQRLAELRHEIPPADQLTPAAFGAFHKAEIDKWWPIIRAANIKAE